MSLDVHRLKRRPEFLRVASARRKWAAPGLVLQARRRGQTDAGRTPPDAVRVGFTVSRKVGNAVTRNRVRRRLRAAAREVLPEHARDGYDFVLIGRAGTVRRPWSALVRDLETALRRLGAWRDGPDDDRGGR